MEIRIGVQNVAREVALESDETPDNVRTLVETALANNTPLTLVDNRGHSVTVPANAIGYVNIAAEQKGRVGFGG